MMAAFFLSLLSAVVALIFNPGRPLWPSEWAHQALAHSARFGWLEPRLEPYFNYAERARTAREIIADIPASEKQFAVLAGRDRPLLPMFQPYASGRRVVFLPGHATPAELNRLAVNYVVVGGGANEVYPELCAFLHQTNGYQLVESREYTSKLARGAEAWQLFERMPRLSNDQ